MVVAAAHCQEIIATVIARGQEDVLDLAPLQRYSNLISNSKTN